MLSDKQLELQLALFKLMNQSELPMDDLLTALYTAIAELAIKCNWSKEDTLKIIENTFEEHPNFDKTLN